jgi:transcriptional regulator with XRE-family HTH domain
MPETSKETTNPYELLSLPDSELLLQKQRALQFLLKKINETELTDRQLSQMSGVAEDTVSRLLSGDIAGISIEDINRLVALCSAPANLS